MSNIDKIIKSEKWPCLKLICLEPEFKKKFGCSGCRLNGVNKQHCTQCENLKAEVERLKCELLELKDKTKTFIMPIELYEPVEQIRVCNECVLSRGPMCLDRSYCKHHEDGKVWIRRL